MLAFLKLIRFPNLLIIAFTMYMVRYYLVEPIVIAKGFNLQMPDLYFFLLALSIVMIAAAGYIINDYFDVRIDQVNKPEEVVVDKGIKRRVAMAAHTVINILGVAIGCFVSYKAHFFKLGSILFLFSATSLWFYSTTFKRQFLVGNIVIAVLSGMVPLISGLYDMSYVNDKFREVIPLQSPELNNTVFVLVAGFSFFAFILTFLRELIKDTEDKDGDEEFGCRTLPVVMGIKVSKWVICILALFVLFLISWLGYDFHGENRSQIPFWYIVALIQIPVAVLIFMVLRAKEKNDFRKASYLTKFIMLAGICFWFVLNQAAGGNWFIR